MKKHISIIPMKNAKAFSMDYHEMSIESKEVITSVAMDIYLDIVNAGHSLQETVAALYYSGIMHAIRLPKYVNDRNNNEKKTFR